jgi:hypothetical protein
MSFSQLYDEIYKKLMKMSRTRISLPFFMMPTFDRYKDEFPAKTREAYERGARHIAALMRRCKKYRLEPDFFALAKEAADCPEAMIELARLALPPFDECWIEYRTRASLNDVPGGEADVTFAMLIEKVTNPEHYSISEPNTVAQYLIHSAVIYDDGHPSLSQFDMVTYEDGENIIPVGCMMQSCLSFEGRVYRLIRNHTTDPDVTAQIDHFDDTAVKNTYVMFKLLLPILGLLSTHISRDIRVARTAVTPRRYLKGRFMPAYEYKIVDLVRPMDAIRLSGYLQGNAPSDRRLHSVSGAWHHRRSNDLCPLGVACKLAFWMPVLSTDSIPVGSHQQQCAVCRRKRWWQPAHERGNKVIGTVEHDYSVTSRVSED